MWIISDKSINSLPVFCREFKLKKSIRDCVIQITSLGVFNIDINENNIDDYFMPGWTNYNKYVNLCEYDITNFIQNENIIKITVADGWFSGRLGYTKKDKVYGDVKALYCKIIINYTDGTKEEICTDKSWKVAPSKIISSSFFDGECIDNRIIEQSYDKLNNAIEYDYNVKMHPYTYSNVKRKDTIIPKILIKEENFIRLDFNQNFSGFITFKIKGISGSEIIIRHAEVLDKDGNLYCDNLRSAVSVDKLILSDDSCIFSPMFTYHGFRYAEILIKGSAKITNIQGVVLTQDICYDGNFECSNSIINRIYKNVIWGQKSNFISIPTDCPQRDERLGWTGDVQVFCHTAMYNANCDDFFSNYLKLVRTDTLEDGKVPIFLPFFIDYSNTTVGIPGWADVICVMPYYHYLHYHNKKILEDNIKNAENHVKFYLSQSQDYLINTENPFGDWLSINEVTSIPVINQCYFGLCSQILSKIFEVLGDKEKSKEYDSLYQNVRFAFRKAYLKNGKIESDTQTAYAFAIMIDFVESNEIHRAFVESIHRNDDKLTTGFVGVKFLLPALCKVGEVDLAYKLIKQEQYPSWGYTINHGATTIWERWNGYTDEKGFENPKMNSFNHYSLGTCVEWLYSNVLGIKLNLDGSITISPDFSKELSYAKGQYNSYNGMVYVDWKYEDNKYKLHIFSNSNVKLNYDFKAKKIERIHKDGNNIEVVLKQDE